MEIKLKLTERELAQILGISLRQARKLSDGEHKVELSELISNKLGLYVTGGIVNEVKKDGNDKNKFSPPTLQELEREMNIYCMMKGMQTPDPNDMLDYYNSNGWMVGRNKMKDWKSAARRWCRKNNDMNGMYKKNNQKCFAQIQDEYIRERERRYYEQKQKEIDEELINAGRIDTDSTIPLQFKQSIWGE